MPSATDDQVADERLVHYRTHPLDFFVDVLGVKREFIWSAMEQMTSSVMDNRFTAVAGCHNSSKTFTAACLSWWWVLCWPNSLVYVTASKEDQIKGTFWEQLRDRYEAAPVPLGGDLLELDWKDEGRRRIVGRTSRKDTGAGGATAMQGFKNERLLLIYDEATAIDRPFWESGYGVIAFPENRWLAMANPTNPNCGFRDCFRSGSRWNSVHFDALANPNLDGARFDWDRQKVTGGQDVHPYLPNAQWCEERMFWGEGSPSWESRVRGRFPSSAIDTLISIADLNSAIDRDPPDDASAAVYLGVDVARQGDDLSVLAAIQGDELVGLDMAQIPDLMKLADLIILTAKRFGITERDAPRITLDVSGGWGWGPHDYLHRIGWPVSGVDFGSSAIDETEFYNRRAEIWCGVRDWLQTSGSLKRAEPRWITTLEGDLCGCTVSMEPKAGRTVYKLEAKKEMKKRLGHSPDAGDALALAIAAMTSTPAQIMESMAARLDSPPTTGSIHPDDEDDEPPGKRSPFGDRGRTRQGVGGNPFS